MGEMKYDITDMRPIANTTFIIKKNGKEIYLLARPSDRGEVRIFYETEKDLLDYSMEWELWVEDGRNEPQKFTFGKIIKLTGLNLQIPQLTILKQFSNNYGIKNCYDML